MIIFLSLFLSLIGLSDKFMVKTITNLKEIKAYIRYRSPEVDNSYEHEKNKISPFLEKSTIIRTASHRESRNNMYKFKQSSHDELSNG